jgi:hypothetical protein
MDKLPEDKFNNPEQPHTDDTQDLGDAIFTGSGEASTEQIGAPADGVPFTADKTDTPATQPEEKHRNRRNVFIASAVGLGLGILGAGVGIGKALSSNGEATPSAHETTLGQETPTPSATTPETPATTEQTPTTSSTSPTNIPTQTETKSVPVAIPTTPSETTPATSETPTTTPSTNETEAQRDELQPSVPITYFKDLIDPATKKELLNTYDDTPTGRSLEYYLSDNIVLQKGLQEQVSAKGINKYQKRLYEAYNKPEVANVLGTPLGLFNQDIVGSYSSPDQAVRAIPEVQDVLINNIAGAVHNPAYNTIKGVNSDLINTAYLSTELITNIKAQIDGGAERFYRVQNSNIVEAKTVNTIDGHKVDIAAVVSTYENSEVKLNWFVHVPLGDKLANLLEQPTDSSIFVPFASYTLAAGNQ